MAVGDGELNTRIETATSASVADSSVEAVWLAWRKRRGEAKELTASRNQIEAKMTAGVRTPLADPEGTAGSMGPVANQAEASADAIAQRNARWDQLDRELGYSKTEAAEVQCAAEAELLFERLIAMPASSLHEIQLKLSAIVSAFSGRPDRDDVFYQELAMISRELKHAAGAEMNHPGFSGNADF